MILVKSDGSDENSEIGNSFNVPICHAFFRILSTSSVLI
jgi:hypothetical protein